MGFTLWYRSSKAHSDAERLAIARTAVDLCKERNWFYCEPVSFFSDTGDGHIVGGSKPNFAPNLDDVETTNAEQLPYGTIRDAIEVLCQISRIHGVDWEITHDDDPTNWIGFIRGGKADQGVLERVAAFAELADPQEKRSSWRIPPIHKCLMGRSTKKLKKILEQGENPNEDHYLELAISVGNIEAAELLLDFGAVPREDQELSALIFAAGWRAVPLMIRLIDLGQDIDGGRTSSTPLVHGAGRGALDSVVFLLSRGATIDKPAVRGITPLMAASFWGHLSVVRLLLEHGADPTLRDESGRTAADFAALPWSMMSEKVIILGGSATESEKKQTAAIFNRTVMQEGRQT